MIAITPAQAAARDRRIKLRRDIERKAAELQRAKATAGLVRGGYPAAAAAIEAVVGLKAQASGDAVVAGNAFDAVLAKLDELLSQSPKAAEPWHVSWHMSIAEIQATVASFYRVTASELKSARRQYHIALARQVAMYICREITPFSYPVIAVHFGKRDHTTAMHACKKIEARIYCDADFAFEVADLIRKLSGEHDD